MYKVGDKVAPREGKFAFFPDRLLTVTSVADSLTQRGSQLLGFYGKEPIWCDYNFIMIMGAKEWQDSERLLLECEAKGVEKALVYMKKELEPKKIDFLAITKAIAEGS
jgi:hypothetical protein